MLGAGGYCTTVPPADVIGWTGAVGVTVLPLSTGADTWGLEVGIAAGTLLAGLADVSALVSPPGPTAPPAPAVAVAAPVAGRADAAATCA